MTQYSLGEFEEVVLLTVAVLDGKAYGVGLVEELKSRVGRNASLGAVQIVLKRLEEKGMVRSEFGEATHARGGKRKRYYTITTRGQQALTQIREQRAALWNAIPNFQFRIA